MLRFRRLLGLTFVDCEIEDAEEKMSKLARALSNITLPITRMAEEKHKQVMATPWIADALPVVVVVLIAAHVIALVYWIYRVATEKQSARRKAH